MDTKRGFTLAELLIVIAIIALLFIIAMWNWRNQIGRGYDARRKSDLARIKIAFEDYYNDKNCYPPGGTLDNCGGQQLQPYMAQIPCDPTRRTPYVYIPLAPDGCSGYRVLAALQDTSDPDIAKIGCSVGGGCGYANASYNYGISSGVPVLLTGSAGSTPTPVSGGAWACAPDGTCNLYADPVASGCPVTFSSGTCDNQCDNPANRCIQ